MRLLALAVVLTLAALQPAVADDRLVVKTSPYGAGETLDRLTEVLTAKGIMVFARVDHAAGAAKVGQELAPTQLLIFGNPKLGTPLMQANREMGLDLPMKVLAYEQGGKTFVTYVRPSELKARHGIADRDKVFQTMTGALDNLTNAAIAE